MKHVETRGDKGVEEWKKEEGLRNSRNARECHYVPKPQEKTLSCISGGNDTGNIRGLSKVISRSKKRLKENRSEAVGSTESSCTLQREQRWGW